MNFKKTWDFQTDYFQIGIDNRGYITSMKNTTVSPQREFSPSDKPSPLLSLYDSEKKVYYTPQRASFDPGTKRFDLEYPNGSVATVSLQEQGKYFKLTLEALSPRNGVDAIQWGSYYTNITNLLGEIIGVARDTSEAVNYSIGLLALDDNTLGGTAMQPLSNTLSIRPMPTVTLCQTPCTKGKSLPWEGMVRAMWPFMPTRPPIIELCTEMRRWSISRGGYISSISPETVPNPVRFTTP